MIRDAWDDAILMAWRRPSWRTYLEKLVTGLKEGQLHDAKARRAEGRMIAMALLGLVGYLPGGEMARAADLVAPPVMYAPNLWQGKSVAVIRVFAPGRFSY